MCPIKETVIQALYVSPVLYQHIQMTFTGEAKLIFLMFGPHDVHNHDPFQT